MRKSTCLSGDIFLQAVKKQLQKETHFSAPDWRARSVVVRLQLSNYKKFKLDSCNWTPTWSPSNCVVNRCAEKQSQSSILLITRMITDRIGLHSVLLPINHIYNKVRERKRRKHTGEGIDNSFICEIGKKRTYSSVTDPLERALWRVLSNYLGMTRVHTVQLHCPINAQILAGNSQSDSRILL